MVRRRKPSKEALLQAWQLGLHVAVTERAVRPLLSEAKHYQTYGEFQLRHRALLETGAAFARWEAKLQRMAEREGRRLGFRLDHHIHAWDFFHRDVVAPIKEIFWRGWEARMRLELFYKEKRKRLAESEAPSVLRTADIVPQLPDLKEGRMSETERWDQLTQTLFGQPSGDESFWELPEAPDVTPPKPGAGQPSHDTSAVNPASGSTSGVLSQAVLDVELPELSDVEALVGLKPRPTAVKV